MELKLPLIYGRLGYKAVWQQELSPVEGIPGYFEARLCGGHGSACAVFGELQILLVKLRDLLPGLNLSPTLT